MEQNKEPSIAGELVELALRDLAEGNTDQMRDALAEMHPAEIAALLEGMPPEKRRATWELVPEDTRGEVLAYVHDEARVALIEEIVAGV